MMPYTKEYIDHLETQRKLFMVINIVSAVMVAVGVYLYFSQRGSLRHEFASITQLERSNCKTKEFLVSSVTVRLRLAKNDTNPAKKAADLRAARVSAALARSFSNELCPESRG